jgi:hypothetical protein
VAERDTWMLQVVEMVIHLVDGEAAADTVSAAA